MSRCTYYTSSCGYIPNVQDQRFTFESPGYSLTTGGSNKIQSCNGIYHPNFIVTPSSSHPHHIFSVLGRVNRSYKETELTFFLHIDL